MSFLLFMLIVLAVSWVVGNTVAWLDYRSRWGGPFNWRIYGGPNVYITWHWANKSE